MGKATLRMSLARLAITASCCVLSVARAEREETPFVLARDGQPAAAIVVPKDSPVPVQFAAHELAAHLEQMTGAKFQVVETRPDQGNAIILGDGALSRAAGIDVSKLKRDGYAISVKSDTVYIAGRDEDNEKSKILLEYMAEELPQRGFTGYPIHWDFQRATLYGTYRFLEELGVRWFFPGPEGTIIPKTRNLSVNCMDLKEEPCFEMRRGTNPWCHRSKPTQVILRFDREELDDLDWGGYECKLWLLRQREDSVHMGFGHRPHCHNWIDRFHESNPEYFALQKDGKRSFEVSRTRALLCYTNEGVYQETLKDIEAFFTGKRPDTRGMRYNEPYALNNGWSMGVSCGDTFSLLPNDGGQFCQCENCQKLYANKELFMHCPKLAGSVKIDGDLSDREWKDSASRGHLFNNIDGKETQWPTQLRIAYDDGNLYVAFTCLDPETPKRSAEARKDYLEVFLDPDRECQRYYWMMINIDGAIISQALFSEGGDRIDDKWKSQAKVGAKRQKDRWFVEMAIPFESLGGEPADDVGGETWGANFCRTMSTPPTRKDTFSGFSPVLRGAFHRPDSFGAIMFGE